MEGLCIFCGRADSEKLQKCRDVRSWNTLYDAARKQNNHTITSISPRNVFPCSPVQYHHNCRSTFILKPPTNGESIEPPTSSSPSPSVLTRSSVNNVSKPDILDDTCIFCRKVKYVPRTNTRRELKSFETLDGHERVKRSSILHIARNSPQAKSAEIVLLFLNKDLPSSEGNYHKICYNNFVKISLDEEKEQSSEQCQQQQQNQREQPLDNAPENEVTHRLRLRKVRVVNEVPSTSEFDLDSTIDSLPEDKLDEEVCYPIQTISYGSEISSVELNELFEPVSNFCHQLITTPEVIDFSMIKAIVQKQAENMNIPLPQFYMKNLPRKVKASFPSLRFVTNEHRCILVYPESLTIDNLVKRYHTAVTELKKLQNLSKEEQTIVSVGKILHEQIVHHEEMVSWPPNLQELKFEKVQNCIPNLLDKFMKVLFSGSNSSTESKSLFLRRIGLSQDIIYSVSKGRIKTPKSILFPAVIKAICNKVEVNKLINVYGHGISTDLIKEIDTETALDVINQHVDHKVVIPEEENLLKEELDMALMVADNIDNLENTATGFGTSHRVNSILVTKRSRCVDQDEQNNFPPTKRKCRRSLPAEKVNFDVPEYFHGKRVGPGVLQYVKGIKSSTMYEDLSESQRINFLTWIALRSLRTDPSLLVPGWTGFNIILRRDVVVIESKITYLDTLDSSATDIKTAYEVLCRGLEIKQRLNLKSVLCVFDQAFYAKAADVKWKHKTKFKDIVMMLGGFHMLMMFLGAVGKRFGDGGLKDLAVQSEVVAEGSVDKVIEGKQYNRAARMHKIIYESLSRMLYERFIDWMDQERPLTVKEVNRLLEEAKKDIDASSMIDFKGENVIKDLNKYFYKYRDDIKQKGTDLQKYWLSYLEMIELFLNLIYSTRVGDWEFYLSCIEQVIIWAFAYDRQNYAKYLLPFLNDMRSLPTTHPEVYQAFCQGEFSVQMSNANGFSRNEADKTIENTINRDCKTSGGYIGFSADFPATQKWVLNASRRGHYRRMIMEHINATPHKHTHRELLPSSIKKDTAAVEKVIACIENMFCNPWEGTDLISITTGIFAPLDLVDDLLNARAKGVDACMNFINLRCDEKSSIDFFDNLTKTNLRTFSSLKKTVSVKSKDRTIPLKMDKDLFARITLISQHRKIDLKTVFQYSAGPLPWSLSDQYGLPRKTNKAAVVKKLEPHGSKADHYPSNGSSVFDGMAVLQKFQPASRASFGDVSMGLFKVFTATSSPNVHVVFDVYRTVSIKNMERLRRGANTDSVRYKNILPSHPIKSWSKIMSSSHNKEEIVNFLVDEWKKQVYRSQLNGKTMYVTQGAKCWKITQDDFDEVPILDCNHEEADTRMLVHAKFSEGPVIVHADDADVFVLLLAHLENLPICYMKLGKGPKSRLLDMSSIHAGIEASYQEGFCSALIGLYSFSGCDSISSIAGKGKVKAINLLKKHPEFIEDFEELGQTCIVTEKQIVNLTRFVCTLYGKKMDDIDLLRYQIFCAKGGRVDPESLPPCLSTLILHIKRANYQALVWRNALRRNPTIPSPNGHGWDVTDDVITIKWLGSKPAPEEVLELLSCLCKRKCKAEDCVCMQAGLKCTVLCTSKCDNMEKDDIPVLPESDELNEDIDGSDVEEDFDQL